MSAPIYTIAEKYAGKADGELHTMLVVQGSIAERLEVRQLAEHVLRYAPANRDDPRPTELAASPSSPASGVRVKALEWRQSFDGMTRADTIVGRYEIWTYHEAGEWFWKREGSLTRAVADEDAAKAECQSDYEAKILSALGEHP